MSSFISENGDFIESEKIVVDQERLKRMILRIYGIERANTKNAKYGEREMKDQIKSIIEGEVKKCY